MVVKMGFAMLFKISNLELGRIGQNNMKWIATCPECDKRIPRNFFFRSNRPCPNCSTAIRPNLAWNILTTSPFVALFLVSVVATDIGYVSWLSIPLSIFVLFSLAWFLFPYVTPFVKKSGDRHKRDFPPLV